MTTFILFLLFLVTLVFGWLLFGLLLRFVLRFLGVPALTNSRIIVATLAIFAIQILVMSVVLVVSPSAPALAMLLSVAGLISLIVFPGVTIAKIFKITVPRAVSAWLMTLIPMAAVNFVVALALRGFLVDSFYIPTNAMAPTLLGEHCQAICPQCSEPNFCSHREAEYSPTGSPNLICPNFHISQIPLTDRRQAKGDHILSLRFLAPRRWDIIVFRYPENPQVNYAKRLVGFPGETVHIKEGAVWINGEKLDPPASLRGIEYLDKASGGYPDLSGTEDNPAILGPDEYFVLGDFSPQSADSRYWTRGAEGHNPYAVPKSHLKGVVTHIYWPFSRWRILR